MKKLCIALLLCCILLANLALLAGCGSTPDYASEANGFSVGWMGDLPDAALLSSLSIPGTHDSGTNRGGLYYSLGQDQDADIATQLTMGVRFLDIRLVLKKGKLSVYHGIINEKLSMDEVMATCRDFLAEHPTECLLMSVKKEHSDGEDIGEAMHALVEAESDLWYTQEAIPTLGEVRGKIVLFRRFADEGVFGVNLYDGFQDSCAFAIEGKVNCYVQDYYKLEVTDNLPAKWQAIVDTFDYAMASADDCYVINFTSAYYDKKILGVAAPETKKTAQYIHEQYSHYPLQHAKYGIVLFDFVTYDLAVSIAKTNFTPTIEAA